MSGGWNALVAPAKALARRRSIILSYHGVAPSNAVVDPEFLRVDPDAFDAQVQVLQQAGFEIVTVAELARRAGGRKPPPGMVALSFDDGMDDNHSHLLPILKRRGAVASVYVTTGLIGQDNPWMAPGTSRMMVEPELKDLVAAGVELGAHTVTHPDMSEMGYDDCLREMVDSRERVAAISGLPVTTFAYPFCKYNDDAVRAARDAGFDAAVTCQWRGSWDPFTMKRVMIGGKDGPSSFLLKLYELYGPLFHSPAGRAFRSSTRAARRRVRAAREGTAAPSPE
jgi:peptidoglycan/xylan/chitin deacetylase (PgdA/CDA1 family)